MRECTWLGSQFRSPRLRGLYRHLCSRSYIWLPRSLRSQLAEQLDTNLSQPAIQLDTKVNSQLESYYLDGQLHTQQERQLGSQDSKDRSLDSHLGNPLRSLMGGQLSGQLRSRSTANPSLERSLISCREPRRLSREGSRSS